LYRKAFWSEVGKHEARGLTKLFYRLAAKIPERVLKKSFAKFEAKHRKKTGHVRTLTFPAPTRDYAYPAEWWDTFSEIGFEGETFMTFLEKEAYLSFKYGDYARIPPEGERKAHPISELALPEEATV
jgi:lipopolysaccharide cholinephosphotransferase